MLELKNVDTFYGNVQALWDISLNIADKEIVALVGANGAGKSTMLNAISGVVHPASGSIEFMGNRIDGIPPHVIVGMGISHIPEGRRLFTEMSVHENLELGAYPAGAWKVRKETAEQIYQAFPIIKERAGQLARTLSGGEQQMLAMGRGLMSRPKLCMFDEPSYGLSPRMMLEVFQIIKSLRDQGITILLVEQNVPRTLEIADRAYVLENGRIVMEGECCNLVKDDYIKKAYLGL
jgi:branched-chain amino acid transport system ATP-binding protein